MVNKFLFLLILIGLNFNLSAQDYPGKRTITYKKQNVRVADFFREVWEQTGMQAFYNDEQLSSDERINVSYKNEPLENVLASLLTPRGLGWYYRAERFVVTARLPLNSVSTKSDEKGRDITGRVVNEKGEPLIGVSIMESRSNTSKEVNTDKNGKFYLKDVNRNAHLIVRRAGYKSMKLESFADSIFIQLVPIIAPLQEVFVNANKLNHYIGSSYKVDQKTIGEQPVNNVLGALQGRVPGFYINQTTGLPGGGFKIRLRGKNSIESESDPLIVVDGVPYPSLAFNERFVNNFGSANNPAGYLGASPLNLLNVNDIESIEILKGPDATALYGGKGGNGVISINSKAPRVGESGYKVNFYQGIGKAVNLVHYMDTRQYLEMRREALRNDGIDTPGVKDYDLNGKWGINRYKDWQRAMIGEKANIYELNLEHRGGGEKYYYRLSGMYRKESTVYPDRKFHYNKKGLKLQINHNSKDEKLSIGISIGYVGDQNLLPAVDMTTFSTLPPNTPTEYKEEEKLNFEDTTFMTNPYAYLLRTAKSTSCQLGSTLNTRFKLNENLEFAANIGFSSINVKEVQVNPSNAFDQSYGIQKGYSYFFDNRYSNETANFYSRWNKDFKESFFSAITGIRIHREVRFQKSEEAFEYLDDSELEDIRYAGSINRIGLEDTSNWYHSFYSQLNFHYANKYYLSLTGSLDGSTRLKKGNRTGLFGALAGSWVFSNERWAENVPKLSFGRLRLSLGWTGNDRYMKNVNRGTYIPWKVLNENNDRYDSYTWEKFRKWDVSLDLGIMNDRLFLTLCYYHNKSTDQLLTGQFKNNGIITYQPINYPAEVLNKGWEIDLNFTPIKHQHFSVSSTLNLSIPRNKLVAFPKLEDTRYEYYYKPGLSLDSEFGYHTSGVDQEDGVYNVTSSGGNSPTFEDMKFGEELGPSFYGGFHNSIIFNGFELSFLFRFAFQKNYDNLMGPTIPGNLGNQPLRMLNRWQQPGDHAAYQKFTGSTGSPAGEIFPFALNSNLTIVEADYLRLQSLQVSYKLSEKYLNRFKIKSCKLYCQGLNLFTITNFVGRDAELATATEAYPSLMVFIAGLQVGF